MGKCWLTMYPVQKKEAICYPLKQADLAGLRHIAQRADAGQ